MNCQVFEPSKNLSTLVKCYWTLELRLLENFAASCSQCPLIRQSRTGFLMVIIENYKEMSSYHTGKENETVIVIPTSTFSFFLTSCFKAIKKLPPFFIISLVLQL